MSATKETNPGEQLLPPGEWATLETYFLGAGYRSASGIYTLGFGADEKAWLDFKASVPKGATVHHYVCWTFDSEQLPPSVDDEDAPIDLNIKKPTKKDLKVPGIHADFWQFMFGTKQFQFDRSLWVVLDVEDARGVKDALHQTFDVDSMSDVSPDEFEAWCEKCNLQMLISMIREGKQAAAKVRG